MRTPARPRTKRKVAETTSQTTCTVHLTISHGPEGAEYFKHRVATCTLQTDAPEHAVATAKAFVDGLVVQEFVAAHAPLSSTYNYLTTIAFYGYAVIDGPAMGIIFGEPAFHVQGYVMVGMGNKLNDDSPYSGEIYVWSVLGYSSHERKGFVKFAFPCGEISSPLFDITTGSYETRCADVHLSESETYESSPAALFVHLDEISRV